MINPVEPKFDLEEPGDVDYYKKTKTFPRLLSRIEELNEGYCRDVLGLLNWDEYRLQKRETSFKDGVKQVIKAPTSKQFLNQIVSYYRKLGKTMKSVELKRIDEAIYVCTLLGGSVFIHPTPQVTGRAVVAQNTLDPTKSRVEYFNPLFLFRNMLVDQLKNLSNGLAICCPSKKISYIDRLSRDWITGDQQFRATLLKEVDRVLSFISIFAPVTPEHIVVTSQVLYRVKNGGGKVSNHLKFQVLLTRPRKGLDVYLLCCPLPKGRMAVPVGNDDNVLHKQQLADPQPRHRPLQSKKCPVEYPAETVLHIRSQRVSTLFQLKRNDYHPSPITNYIDFNNWNTFELYFDLEGQEGRFGQGLLVKLVYGKVVFNYRNEPKYSLC